MIYDFLLFAILSFCYIMYSTLATHFHIYLSLPHVFVLQSFTKHKYPQIVHL